jgi:hypothetical protein
LKPDWSRSDDGLGLGFDSTYEGLKLEDADQRLIRADWSRSDDGLGLGFDSTYEGLKLEDADQRLIRRVSVSTVPMRA